jgi:hypothetical protein
VERNVPGRTSNSKIFNAEDAEDAEGFAEVAEDPLAASALEHFHSYYGFAKIVQRGFSGGKPRKRPLLRSTPTVKCSSAFRQRLGKACACATPSTTR